MSKKSVGIKISVPTNLSTLAPQCFASSYILLSSLWAILYRNVPASTYNDHQILLSRYPLVFTESMGFVFRNGRIRIIGSLFFVGYQFDGSIVIDYADYVRFFYFIARLCFHSLLVICCRLWVVCLFFLFFCPQ